MKPLMIQVLLCLALCVSAQEVVSQDSVANVSQQESTQDNLVFVVVESMPEFPGGQQMMMKFIAENIKYPAEAHQRGLEGRAICQFTVEKDGRVTDGCIVRSTGHKLLDEEALRVISTMPAWKPGMQRGKPVRVKYTVPINFRLSETTALDRSVPQFPGGLSQLNEYVKANIRYPKAAYERGIRGKTMLEFLVETDGTISQVKVVQSATFKSLDDEAIRLVKSMPNWLPALRNGKPVAQKTTLPIGFGVK